MDKPTSDLGISVSAGWYLAIGTQRDAFSAKDRKAVALVTITGEAPFLKTTYDCPLLGTCDHLHLTDRIEPSSELEARIIQANYQPANGEASRQHQEA